MNPIPPLLKSCPFCGRPATSGENPDPISMAGFVCGCTDCMCCGYNAAFGILEHTAISMWNARAPAATEVTVSEEMIARALFARVMIPAEGDGVTAAEVRDFLCPGIHTFNNERAIMRAALAAALSRGGKGAV